MMMDFNKAINELQMASSLYWYGRVLMKEDVHVFRRALEVTVDVNERSRLRKKTWKAV